MAYSHSSSSASSNKPGKLKLFLAEHYKKLIVLLVMNIAMFTELFFLWGVLFIVMAVLDLRRGSTWLMETVDRYSEPVLYWIIVVHWLVFGIAALLGAYLYSYPPA